MRAVLYGRERFEAADDSLFAERDSAGRYEERHGVSYSAELRVDDVGAGSCAYTAATLNMSERGCAIRVYGAVASAMVATLHISCGSRPVDVPVRVVWTGTDARGHIVGLAFDGLTATQQAVIERLISAKPKA